MEWRKRLSLSVTERFIAGGGFGGNHGAVVPRSREKLRPGRPGSRQKSKSNQLAQVPPPAARERRTETKGIREHKEIYICKAISILISQSAVK